MKYLFFFKPWLLVSGLLLAAFSGVHAGSENKLNTYEVNNLMMSFHDSYQEALSETIDTILAEDVNPTSRTIYQTIKVFYVQSSLDITAGSEAAEQLINMLVMLRLQVLVWEEGGHELATPRQKKLMLTMLNKQEQEFHKIARKVFSKNEIGLILNMAREWRRNNLDRQYVAFVRFSDLSASKDKAKIDEVISGGGLFSSISEANVEIEETRHLLEKGLFVAHHMPILMQWHAQLFMYKALSTSEIQDALSQSQRITESAERISMKIETFPADMDKLMTESSKPIAVMLADLKTTTDNLKLITKTIKPLLETDHKGEKVELDRLERMFELALENSKELVTITENLNKFSYDSEAMEHLVAVLGQQITSVDKLLDTRVNDIDQRLIQHRKLILDRVFVGLVIFCILFPLIFFSTYLFVRRHLIHYHKKINSNEV